MSKNKGKSELSKNVLFNANKHVFHCEKSLGTLFYGQSSYFLFICFFKSSVIPTVFFLIWIGGVPARTSSDWYIFSFLYVVS
jgi:hypothetical protein